MNANVKLKLNSVTLERDKYTNNVNGMEVWYTIIFAKGNEAEGHIVIKQELGVPIMKLSMVEILDIVAARLSGEGSGNH
jgi:hypothetical protein